MPTTFFLPSHLSSSGSLCHSGSSAATDLVLNISLRCVGSFISTDGCHGMSCVQFQPFQ